jgi:uncharacterized protein YjbJ (UPF0337 family)
MDRMKKGMVMNRDNFEGKYTELKGKIKEKWGDLTDDEYMQAEGKTDVLAGKIQQKYGGVKEDIQYELEHM